MKTILYYFTGTGNSLKIARDLAKGLENAELAPITGGIRDASDLEADRIGLVFPTYMYRPPRIVMDFIRRLKTRSYVFAVATNAGDPGDMFRRLRAAFRATGTKLRAAFGVKMVSNYTPFGEPPPEEEIRARFEAAAEKLKEILDVVRSRGSHFDADGGFYATKIHPGILYRLGYAMIPKMDGDFHAGDGCNSCGTCEKVCPVSNVVLEEGRPVWKHRCEQCFACLQWCPTESIDYGKKTAGRKRYRHPEVKLKDMREQQRRFVQINSIPPGNENS